MSEPTGQLQDAKGKFAKGNPGGELRCLLTAKRHKQLVELIGQSNYLSTAARASGVSPRSFKGWMKRGQADLEAGKQTRFAKLFADCRTASAQSEAKLVASIKRAGIDGVEHTRTHSRTGEDGKVVTHVETTLTPPDWRASDRLLQSIARSRFGHSHHLEVGGGIRHSHIVMTAEDEEVARRIVKSRFELVEPGEAAPLPRLNLPSGEHEETHDNGEES